RTRGDGVIAFDDAVGQVSGTWVTGRPPATPGLLIYIMVDSVAATIDIITAHGGEIVQPIGADAPEITARFRDPGGNVIGLYRRPSLRAVTLSTSAARRASHGTDSRPARTGAALRRSPEPAGRATAFCIPPSRSRRRRRRCPPGPREPPALPSPPRCSTSRRSLTARTSCPRRLSPRGRGSRTRSDARCSSS